MDKIRVTRVLVYEGEEQNVRKALEDCFCSPGHSITLGVDLEDKYRGVQGVHVTEIDRKEEKVGNV